MANPDSESKLNPIKVLTTSESIVTDREGKYFVQAKIGPNEKDTDLPRSLHLFLRTEMIGKTEETDKRPYHWTLVIDGKEASLTIESKKDIVVKETGSSNEQELRDELEQQARDLVAEFANASEVEITWGREP